MQHLPLAESKFTRPSVKSPSRPSRSYVEISGCRLRFVKFSSSCSCSSSSSMNNGEDRRLEAFARLRHPVALSSANLTYT
jgi:hypothetical protein